MSITFHAVGNCELNYKVAILATILLAGCSTVDPVVTDASDAKNALCSDDTSIFCVENDQQKAARLNNQGLEVAAKQDYARAAELFEQATTLDRVNPEYFYNLGVAYSFMGQLVNEEAAYLAALAIKPNSPDTQKLDRVWANVYFNLACLYALQGKKDRAFEQLDNLATLAATDMFHLVQNDKDLDSLRDDPRFKSALDKIANSGKSSQTIRPPAQ